MTHETAADTWQPLYEPVADFPWKTLGEPPAADNDPTNEAELTDAASSGVRLEELGNEAAGHLHRFSDDERARYAARKLIRTDHHAVVLWTAPDHHPGAGPDMPALRLLTAEDLARLERSSLSLNLDKLAGRFRDSASTESYFTPNHPIRRTVELLRHRQPPPDTSSNDVAQRTREIARDGNGQSPAPPRQARKSPLEGLSNRRVKIKNENSEPLQPSITKSIARAWTTGETVQAQMVDLDRNDHRAESFTSIASAMAVYSPLHFCSSDLPTHTAHERDGALALDKTTTVAISTHLRIDPGFVQNVCGDIRHRDTLDGQAGAIVRRRIRRLYDRFLVLGARAAGSSETDGTAWPGLVHAAARRGEPAMDASGLARTLYRLIDGDDSKSVHDLTVLISPTLARALEGIPYGTRSCLDEINGAFGATVTHLLAETVELHGRNAGCEPVIICRGYQRALQSGLLNTMEMVKGSPDDPDTLRITLTAESPVVLRQHAYARFDVMI